MKHKHKISTIGYYLVLLDFYLVLLDTIQKKALSQRKN